MSQALKRSFHMLSAGCQICANKWMVVGCFQFKRLRLRLAFILIIFFNQKTSLEGGIAKLNIICCHTNIVFCLHWPRDGAQKLYDGEPDVWLTTIFHCCTHDVGRCRGCYMAMQGYKFYVQGLI